MVSLLREICHYLHQPSTWGNQRGELTTLHQDKFLAPLPGTQGATSRQVPTIANLRSCCRTPVYKIGELHTIFYLCFLVLLVYLSVFTFLSLIKNTKIPAATMGSNENTKLCDFTSHNNSDFICTPIAPPATSAPSYEIKLAFLNFVMKDQFSIAGDDASLHLNNFVELCDMKNYEEVDGDIVKLK